MKKHTIYLLALLVLCLSHTARLSAQSLPVNLIGHNLLETSNGMAILPSGASVFGGSSSIPNQGNKLAYIVWENATNFGVVDFAKTYSLGTGDLVIKAVDAAQPAGSIAIVANRLGAGTNPDGLFMHISATGTVLAARAFNSGNHEFLQNVKCLSDGSFVVMGSIANASTQMKSAFVTRIGTPAQGYAVQWSRALGTISGGVPTFDYAAAADQFSDGSILVAGFTDQGSSSIQGSVFLWKLSAAGTDLSLIRYTMDSNVRRPFPSDMRIAASNTVQIVGNALDANGNFKGFHMRVTPSLGSATYGELTLAEDQSRSIELRSLDTRGGNVSWASGMIRVPTSSGGSDFEGLMVQYSPLTGLMRSHLLGFTGEDAFNDIRMDASNNVRASGLSNKSTGTPFVLESTNILNVRTNTLGLNCLTRDVSLVETQRSNVAQSFGLGSVNPVTIVVSPITVVVSNITAVGFSSCVSARMGIADEVEEVATPAAPVTITETQPSLFPNPAQGTATLRLPAFEQPTPVYVYDLSGKRVRTTQTRGTETELDLGGLTPGLYIVSVKAGAGNHRLKLVVE